MSEWKPIEQKPDNPMPVLLYFANRYFTDALDGHRVEGRSDGRDENAEVGFWTGDEWCENGTGHSIFIEADGDPRMIPTHWQPLPAPPDTRKE